MKYNCLKPCGTCDEVEGEGDVRKWETADGEVATYDSPRGAVMCR